MPRASEFTQETADAICEQIASGKSLRAICAAEDMPATSTVCKWLGQQSAFAEQYARAREAQADALFDEILDIADESANDFTEGKNGETVVNSEAIARSRLRVDARKWMAAKLRPKVYGDKVETVHSGELEIRKITRAIVDPKAQ